MTLRLTEHVVHVGEALEVLRGLPDESVHCVVTSPPYYGLRDYQTASWEGGDPECDHQGPPMRTTGGLSPGWDPETGAIAGAAKAAEKREFFSKDCGKCGARRVDQQLGLEPAPEEYVDRMVEVFREVRRVLRADGVCWLNLGDSYAASGPAGGAGKQHTNQGSVSVPVRQAPPGLRPKDLVGIPWRVAFAIQADDWYLRSDVIWAKPNPMPESVRDRPTKAHEYLFLLTKSARYFWDQEAVREESSGYPDHQARRAEALTGNMAPDADNSADHRNGRNIRSIWTIATQPFPEAHFATFPPELPRRCILAGTSERGCCPECGAPWGRVVEKGEPYQAHWKPASQSLVAEGIHGDSGVLGNGMINTYRTTGWRPTCNHEADPIPCTVLDPFAGSGTTGMVAALLGQDSIGIELNPGYAEMARRRIANGCSLWATVRIEPPPGGARLAEDGEGQ